MIEHVEYTEHHHSSNTGIVDARKIGTDSFWTPPHGHRKVTYKIAGGLYFVWACCCTTVCCCWGEGQAPVVLNNYYSAFSQGKQGWRCVWLRECDERPRKSVVLFYFRGADDLVLVVDYLQAMLLIIRDSLFNCRCRSVVCKSCNGSTTSTSSLFGGSM